MPDKYLLLLDTNIVSLLDPRRRRGAATALRHGLIVLTRNMREFGWLAVPACDPLVELPADT